MAAADSLSHQVYVGPAVVVKVIDAARHARLDREIALTPQLPPGLTAPLLASGLWQTGALEVRYACYARVRGTTPGMGLPDTDSVAVRLLAEQAVERLGELHGWLPAGDTERTLREPLDHGGFVSRDALLAEIDNLTALDRSGLVSARLLSGLKSIAERAPTRAQITVPVHADCHWGNWLADDGRVTALLDFEWARFGEPADDWFFLIRFSGPHREAVLDMVAGLTAISEEALRAECEVREASHLVSDIRVGLQRPGSPSPMTADRLDGLEDLIIGRSWWRHTG